MKLNKIQKTNHQKKILIEIAISCGEDNDLKKYIDEGWDIIKENSKEKICSWKSVPAEKILIQIKIKVAK